MGRDSFLAFVASGDLTHSAMDFTVLDARVYGDVAVILAHGTNQGKWRGEPFISDEWVTDVFVRRPGDLEDHSYGGRSFSSDDPEGHAWTFGQTIREVAPEDWGAVAT
ncbi:nuclear transport factor 2 family protein [Rhodococcus sp. SMB37]|uniref:nuclear transport factor 2 family protein n=1 Tax=Rhodococcus sp. SMB37 TaxID=2512213 RepID=UPI001F542C93|nr:nuclear transport factor 2 family protein [Rhodococcus sp. SMB37]